MTQIARKTICILAGVLFFLTNAAFAYVPEQSIWLERKKSVSATPQSLSVNNPLPVLGPIEIFLNSPTASSSQKTVLTINDIHLHSEAQSNIARTLTAVLQKKKIDLVALEGAFSPIDLSSFQSHPNQFSVAKVAQSLLHQQQISGPIFSLLTAGPNAPPAIGVDSQEHYRANIEALKRSADFKQFNKKIIQTFAVNLAYAKTVHLNEPLSAFDKAANWHENGTTTLAQHLRFLSQSDLGRSALIDTFLEAQKLEASLDLRLLEKEKSRLAKELSGRLSNEDLLVLTQSSQQTGMTQKFLSLCREKGIDTTHAKSLQTLARLDVLLKQLDGQNIFKNTQMLEKKGFDRLARNSIEKNLIALSRQQALITKLLDFSLTRDEWNEYKRIQDSHPWMQTLFVRTAVHLDPFERFYKEAELRDQAMAENLLKEMASRKADTAILVTGGFHAEGIRSRLQKAGVHVVSVSPRITGSTQNQESSLDVFLNDQTPLEKIFTGDALFLSQPPVTRTTLLQAERRLGIGKPFSLSGLVSDSNPVRKMAEQAKLKWTSFRFSSWLMMGLLTTFLAAASVSAQNTMKATLQWDIDPNSFVGYRIHYGAASGGYDWTKDVGHTNRAVIEVPRDQTTYIAVTAYVKSGGVIAFESGYSSEVSLTPPALKVTEIQDIGNQKVFRFSYPRIKNEPFLLQTSTNLVDWVTATDVLVESIQAIPNTDSERVMFMTAYKSDPGLRVFRVLRTDKPISPAVHPTLQHKAYNKVGDQELFWMNLTYTSGRTVAIETSTNLVNWVPTAYTIESRAASVPGRESITVVTSHPISSKRFFRARESAGSTIATNSSLLMTTKVSSNGGLQQYELGFLHKTGTPFSLQTTGDLSTWLATDYRILSTRVIAGTGYEIVTLVTAHAQSPLRNFRMTEISSPPFPIVPAVLTSERFQKSPGGDQFWFSFLKRLGQDFTVETSQNANQGPWTTSAFTIESAAASATNSAIQSLKIKITSEPSNQRFFRVRLTGGMMLWLKDGINRVLSGAGTELRLSENSYRWNSAWIENAAVYLLVGIVVLFIKDFAPLYWLTQFPSYNALAWGLFWLGHTAAVSNRLGDFESNRNFARAGWIAAANTGLGFLPISPMAIASASVLVHLAVNFLGFMSDRRSETIFSSSLSPAQLGKELTGEDGLRAFSLPDLAKQDRGLRAPRLIYPMLTGSSAEVLDTAKKLAELHLPGSNGLVHIEILVSDTDAFDAVQKWIGQTNQSHVQVLLRNETQTLQQIQSLAAEAGHITSDFISNARVRILLSPGITLGDNFLAGIPADRLNQYEMFLLILKGTLSLAVELKPGHLANLATITAHILKQA